MNRRRFSASSCTQRKGAEPLINYSGPSYSDLPPDIIVKILLRLTLKRICVCKLVCKTWLDLISKPEFAKLQIHQAQAYPLAQISGSTSTRHSRILYLVQPEKEDFELKLEMCDHSEYNSKCDCHVNFELDTKFKLPLRNFQMVADHIDRRPNLRNRTETNNIVRLTMQNHYFRIVNSCNGLLCLSSPSDHEPCVVCNPVTGEFVNLPEAKKVSSKGIITLYGFGFSPASNQYKVVRIIMGLYQDSIMLAEVHTLGTETWKEVEVSAKAMNTCSPTYFDGYVYWDFERNFSANQCHLIYFDMENECFGSISAPTNENSSVPKRVNVGVLGGELCVSCFFPSEAIEVWVLRNYGSRKEWSKVVSIHLDQDEISLGECRPIKYMNDGALLMYDLATYSLIYKHPRKPGFRYFEFCRRKVVDLTAHIPSFVSLKDALSGYNVKVLNVNSRCGNLKIPNEDGLISVVEKDICKPR